MEVQLRAGDGSNFCKWLRRVGAAVQWLQRSMRTTPVGCMARQGSLCAYGRRSRVVSPPPCTLSAQQCITRILLENSKVLLLPLQMNRTPARIRPLGPNNQCLLLHMANSEAERLVRRVKGAGVYVCA